MPYKTLWDCTLILQSVKDGKLEFIFFLKNFLTGI